MDLTHAKEEEKQQQQQEELCEGGKGRRGGRWGNKSVGRTGRKERE